MNKNRRINYIIKLTALTIILLFMPIIIASGATNNPTINVKLIVSDLTDEEFESVGTYGLVNPVKDDFKKIRFALHVNQLDNVTDRNITIPAFYSVVNAYGKDRYWFGSSYKQDNPQDNFANYENEFVIYSKGLNEQDMKDIFSSEIVKISWNTKHDYYEENNINLGDIIVFK